MYTAPMAVSEEVYMKLHQKVLKLIEELVEDAQSSPAEKLAYFTLDLREM